MNDANQAFRAAAHRAETTLYMAAGLFACLSLKASALSQARYGEKWGWYPMVMGVIVGLAMCAFIVSSALALRKARLASEESEEAERLKSRY